MQIVSRAYKNEQREYLREYSYIWVYLGVISREAQRNAETQGEFTDFSSPQDIFDGTEFEAYYATAEENYAVPGMYFLPRDPETYALFQGAVTDDFLSPVTFTFGEFHHLDIKGLTIDFGDYYPTSFSITNGNVTNYYQNTAPGQWITEDEFLNTGYITITPYQMVGGNQRLRILSMLFGIGFTFGNKELISTQWKSTIAHLSDKLPTQTFTFTVDNTSKKFAADDPHSWVAFLEEQQEVNFDFGRDVGDGTIERIPGGMLALKSWSSNDQQAKFNAVGKADYITSNYYKGQYYPDGISLFDLAMDVIEDAEIEDYIVDTYLKKVITHNPLPIDSHKNLLQLIANTARSILYEDRKGRVVIKSSFIPEVTEISSNTQTSYSKVENILKEDVAKAEYATAESNFSGTDGHQYFLPRSVSPYIEHGYVSGMVSNDEGYFEGTSDNFMRFIDSEGNVITGLRFVMADSEIISGKFIGEGIEVDMNESTFLNPIVTIEFEAKWTFFNLYLRFADVYPVNIKIHTYADGEENAVFDVTEIDFATIVEHDFYDIDKIVLEFTQTNPNQRIHLSKVRFGSITDYTLTYREMKDSPTAMRTNFTRDINVHYYGYSYGTEEKTVSTVKEVSTEEENLATFSKACHEYSLVYKEISDDEETYSKESKEIVDELPDIESAESGYYFVRTENGFDIYKEKTEDDVSSFELISSATESIVSELPETLEEDVVYAVTTDTENIYHLYMKLKNHEEEWETYSFGYDVRGTLTIINSGAYYVTFTSETEAEVEIKGIEFIISDSITTDRVKEIGEDKTSENKLIDCIDLAEKQAEWLHEYYDNDLEYTVTYRGEPAIDPDDQIYLESRYVLDNLVRVTETQISTSQGMGLNCKLKARRVSYSEASRVNYAIVNESEVSRG